MTSLSILYLGPTSSGSTTYHRLNALRRLGHDLTALDPLGLIPRSGKLWNWIDYNTGYCRLQNSLYSAIQQKLNCIDSSFDIIWVTGGELLGPSLLLWLKNTYSCPLVLYCNDDPTGPRDGMRFATLRRSMSHYDLSVCCRDVCELEWLARGSPQVLRVWMSFDEVIHKSMNRCEDPQPEVSFIGTNIPGENRDLFLQSLAASGCSLRIFGIRWQRSKAWNTLRHFYVGTGLLDEAYASQLACSALSLGLLSHGNRDLYTTRSFEIPACGGVLLAERTSEHQLLFEDGVEALFWDTADECSNAAKKFINNPQSLTTIRDRGNSHVLSAGLGHEDICKQILASLFT